MTGRTIIAIVLAVGLTGCANEPPAPANPPASTSTTAATPASGPVTPPTTDEEMVLSAKAAAPAAVSNNATVIAMNEKMETRTLQQGSNGWTCMPDNPQSPGADPICVDANGMEWLQAWVGRKNPPADKMGFGYMLMGGSDAMNDDPFATKPAEGHQWVDTGPHVMILNIGDRFAGYPATHDDTTKPYVMWPNTPYRHLMIPVK